MLDVRINDQDADSNRINLEFFSEEDIEEDGEEPEELPRLSTEKDFQRRAGQVFEDYSTKFKTRFKWLRTDLFDRKLARHLRSDARTLIKLLEQCGDWQPQDDAKLEELATLISKRHPKEKIIVFTQFADTVYYLTERLKERGIERLAGVTGDALDPTALAFRFSPASNNKKDQISPEQELRVLVATDVLSEGQNLQDAAIVVNYDLPWAIIRLIQRAGRVDRIGQQSDRILCYSFLPADGVERIIRLRARVRQRLHENAAFLDFIEGLAERGDREWYASIMLNRLMFLYFIQKKGFLDDDHDYLRHRLEMVQENKGKNQFHTFYRYFLLRLMREVPRRPDPQDLRLRPPSLRRRSAHHRRFPVSHGKRISHPPPPRKPAHRHLPCPSYPRHAHTRFLAYTSGAKQPAHPLSLPRNPAPRHRAAGHPAQSPRRGPSQSDLCRPRRTRR